MVSSSELPPPRLESEFDNQMQVLPTLASRCAMIDKLMGYFHLKNKFDLLYQIGAELRKVLEHYNDPLLISYIYLDDSNEVKFRIDSTVVPHNLTLQNFPAFFGIPVFADNGQKIDFSYRIPGMQHIASSDIPPASALAESADIPPVVRTRFVYSREITQEQALKLIMNIINKYNPTPPTPKELKELIRKKCIRFAGRSARLKRAIELIDAPRDYNISADILKNYPTFCMDVITVILGIRHIRNKAISNISQLLTDEFLTRQSQVWTQEILSWIVSPASPAQRIQNTQNMINFFLDTAKELEEYHYIQKAHASITST